MKSRAPRGSLLITTYEMPRHLSLVLAGVETQSTQDFEIFLCDDGSGSETQSLIESFATRVPMTVTHLWQENKGFRKCRILNQALRQARGETIIFLDGDCIPHRHYVSDHLEMQERGRYLCGRRLDLGPKISDWLTADGVRAGFFDYPGLRLATSVWSGDSKNLQRALRVKNPWIRQLLGMEKIPDLLGSNYSVSKSDLFAINGFDEDYEGYGREDTDAEIRLQHLGLRIKSVKGAALQFHIWHPRRAFTPANDDRLQALKKSRRSACIRGLNTGD